MSIYRCDPLKNKKCPKTNCYINVGKDYCMHTVEKQYRMNIFKRIKEWFGIYSGTYLVNVKKGGE